VADYRPYSLRLHLAKKKIIPYSQLSVSQCFQLDIRLHLLISAVTFSVTFTRSSLIDSPALGLLYIPLGFGMVSAGTVDFVVEIDNILKVSSGKFSAESAVQLSSVLCSDVLTTNSDRVS